ncbi:MAG: hypothetical protein Q9163_005567 [Psora crenata]
MSESTFHTTKEDIRKAESKVSQKNDGYVPSESEPSLMKSIVDENQDKSKSDIIEERRTNLPLPEQPPVASDWNSSDGSKVNVGSGGVESDISYGGGGDSLREPATSDSSVRADGETLHNHAGAPNAGIGRQGHDHLDELPKDARKSYGHCHPQLSPSIKTIGVVILESSLADLNCQNTSDSKRYNDPIRESTGAVVSDSLAAESVRAGGKFAENRNSEPLAVKGGNSTFNTTDTSGAITLPPVPNAGARGDTSDESGQGTKYPEDAGGQGGFPGTHSGGTFTEGGYAGGSTSAKREMGVGSGGPGASGGNTDKISSSDTGPGHNANGSSGGDTSYNTSYGGGDYNKPGLSGENNSGRDAAPGYVSGVTQPFHQGKPKGKNLKEEDLDGPTTQDADIGSDQDPGRKAEGDFQRTTQTVSGSTAPRQKGQGGDAGTYDVLNDEQSL